MPNPTPAKPYQPKKKGQGKRYFIIGLLALALISFILTSIPRATPPPTGPVFRDDGDLTLLRADTDEVIATLDIEIAYDEASITQGLMYRESMADDQGMLFLMGDEQPRSFWMLNTYITLDIIFVGADQRIVKIRENTTPKSTEQVLSIVPAAYVLEVNAGYAKTHGLQEGDRLAW
jgi:hypothetical protein